MKTRLPKNNAAKIPASRWLSYAAAGAATAFAGSTSAKAEIHYSGQVDTTFRWDEQKTAKFPLDQEGNFFSLEHYLTFRGGAYVFFGVKGLVDEAFLASDFLTEYYLVDRLHGEGYVSRGPFINVDHGTLYGFGRGFWRKRGTDYIGIRFDNGAGVQYGWIRIQMSGQNKNFAFRVLDYAYADPGEPIKTGQRSSAADVPTEGSLGFLALGAAGLTLWRQRRRKSAAV